MNIGKNRVRIGVLAICSAICLLCGLVFAGKNQEAKRALADSATVTVEDIYDVTSRVDDPKTFWYGQSSGGGSGNFKGYQASSNKNYEFSAYMTLDFSYNKEFVFGIMANEADGINATNDGYWFVLNEDTTITSGRTIKLWTTRKQYVAGVLQRPPVVLTNTNGELDGVWAEMLDKDGFAFNMGVENKIDAQNQAYTYVYVKINGETVVEYNNYNTENVTYGKYIFADTAKRANIYANKDLVIAEKTVENISDITDGQKTFDGITELKNGFAPMGVSSVENNFEFNSQVLFMPLNDTKNELPIGILCSGTNTASDGYWFVLNKTDNSAKLFSGRANNKDNCVRTTTAPATIDDTDGFSLAFGVVEVSRGGVKAWNYVYVKINGELLFEYRDIKYTDRTALGTNVLADTHSRASFFFLPDVEDVVAEESTRIDLYDVWGSLERGSGSPFKVKVGETSVSKNLVFTSRVILAKGHKEAPIGILTNKDDTYGNVGYWFVINETEGLHLVRGFYGPGDRARMNIVQSHERIEEMYESSGSLLEFGAVNYSHEGEFAYTLVTAKINGETVFEYKDYVQMEFGNKLVADTYLRCTLRSAQEGLTYDVANVVDWYELSGQISTLYDHSTTDPSKGLEYTMGNLPDSKNVALKTKLTLGDVGYDKDHSRTIWFLKKLDVRYDEGTGYYFTWTDSTIQLGALEQNENGNHVKRIGMEGATPANFACGNTVELELGTIKMYLNNVYVGDCVYVKIDGKEIMSMMDENPRPDNGTFVMSPYGSSIGQWEIFSSTRDFVTFTSEDELVDITELTVFSDQDYVLNIPVSVGYKVTSVMINGTPIEFSLTQGGAQVSLAKGFSGGEIDVVAERSEVGVTITGLASNEYALNGVVEGKASYGSNITLSFDCPSGKKLSSLKVNGVDSFDKAVANGNGYELTLYSLVADMAIELTFEDVTYSVTAKQLENGQITLSATSVAGGGTISFTVTVNEGYRLKGVTVNGKSISVNERGEGCIENICEDIEISAEFLPYVEEEAPTAGGGCASSIGLGTTIGGLVLILAVCGILLVRRKARND